MSGRRAKDIAPKGSLVEAASKDALRPEAFQLKGLYLGTYPSAGKITTHLAIVFAVDALPAAKLLPVGDAKTPTPIYRHVTKDRLMAEVCVARLATGKGGADVFLNDSLFIGEGMFLQIKTFNSCSASLLDLVEFNNVRLNKQGEYAASLLFDSIRVLPSEHQGFTGLDRALAIYRATTRFIPEIIDMANSRAVRDLYPIKDKKSKEAPAAAAPTETTATAEAPDPEASDEEEGEAAAAAPVTRAFKKDILGSFPVPLLEDWTKEGNPEILKQAPIYEAFVDSEKTSISWTVPRPPMFVNNATVDGKSGKVVIPAEPRLVTQANLTQVWDTKSQTFHINNCRVYTSNMVGLPTLYPPELAALFTYHRIPFALVANVNLSETLNSPINQSHVSSRGDWPDGYLDLKVHAAVYGFDRYLIEQGIPIPHELAQERYGGGTTSAPYVQDDRGAIDKYREEKKYSRLTVPYTSKQDKVWALDSAPLPLQADRLYFALELRELDIDKEERAALNPTSGAKLVRDNVKKNPGDDKLHGRWIQSGGDGKKYGFFLFYSMDKAYAEKLRSMAGKPLDTAGLFAAPKEVAVVSKDALPTIQDFYNKYFLDAENKGTKRPLEDGEVDPDEPSAKESRTDPVDGEKTRDGVEEDQMDTDE